MPSSTVEDYLKTILHLQSREKAPLVSMGDIAVSLSVVPGTVTSMVKTLADSGLVHYEPYSGVRLSEAGRHLATRVLRRHRLIELFLVQVMEIDWGEVHSEAEQLEHVVSDRLVDRMEEMLGFPSVDPHGDPIPSADGELVEFDHPSLVTCPLDLPWRVSRITDQSPDFLQFIEGHGLVPGSSVSIVERNETADTVTVRLANGTVARLGLRAGLKVLVEPD